MWTGAVLLAVVSQRDSVDTSGRNFVGGLVMRVAYHRLAVCLGSVLLVTFSASAQTWRQVGPHVLDDLAPVRNGVVVSTGSGTLFLSRDGGRSWGKMDGPAVDSRLSALRSRQAGSQLVAASSTEGLFIFDMGSASSASADPVAVSPTGKP